jgi:hypothetical protein
MDSIWTAEGPRCRFENDAVAGWFLTSGEYQGMRSLVHRPTGVEVAAGETLPGLVAPYRVFGNGQRYSDIRDREPQVALGADGLTMRHPADPRNPFDLSALYSWQAGTLDIRYTLTTQAEMRGFEIGIASYLAAGFRGYVSRQSNVWGEDAPRIVPVDVNPMTDVYALFPRSEAELKTIFDGRWDLPPYPVRYAVPGYFALPLAYRQQAASGVAALGMADPRECHAICLPVNNPPEVPDPAHGYQAVYFYFFGRDLREGETVTWRLRWVIGQDLTDEEIRAQWEAFAAQRFGH